MLPPHYRFLFEVLGLEVLAQLIYLSVEGVNNLVFALQNIFELDFFCMRLMDFIGPLLHFQLHLLVLVHQGFRLEFDAVDLGLQVPVLVFEFFELFLVLQELIVFVQFQRIALPSHFIEFLDDVL